MAGAKGGEPNDVKRFSSYWSGLCVCGVWKEQSIAKSWPEVKLPKGEALLFMVFSLT